MALAEILKLLITLSLASHATAADDGDDFSNNLFSDLAPLLTLFGERVAMQFMSQSMGWADNFIFAMAPLGIITAIVSAIRVGGPSWLKALVGRARENLATAEMDIMSSTSKEVCELWNRQEVVRCMGSAPVTEFICLLFPTHGAGAEIKRGDFDGAHVEVMDLEMAKKSAIKFQPGERGQYLSEIHLNIQEDFNRWRASRNLLYRHKDPENDGKYRYTRQPEVPTVVIVRNKSDAAPNISLNCHNQVWRGELRAAAVLGAFIQLGVLVFSGFATYFPTWTWLKDDRPVAKYAFPCTAIGTVVLVIGMLACAHVVESSTKEERYQTGRGGQARLVWLQEEKTVNDQDFDSFALFAKDGRNIITTSRRLGNEDKSRDGPVNGEESAEDASDEASPTVAEGIVKKPGRSGVSQTGDHTTALAFKAGLGTFISLCGFVVQFIGLRGMHWSASIAQLCAVVVMTGLRAWVRRGLAKRLACQPLLSGFELDWFAMTFGDIDNAPWLHPSTVNEEKHSRPWAKGYRKWDWCIGTVGDPVNTYKPFHPIEYGSSHSTGRSKAHRVMMIRRDLAELADWRGSASEEAIALARAIEITMDALGSLIEDSIDAFIWTLPGLNGDSIDFRLERQQNGKWKSYSDEVDATLSLWLYSVNQQEQGHLQPTQKSRGAPGFPRRDDGWLRATGSPAKLSLRLLGPYTADLHQDLWWWMPRDTARIMKVEEDLEGKTEEMLEEELEEELEVENHRVVGCGSSASVLPGKRTYRGSKLSRPNLEPTQKDIHEEMGTRVVLATELHCPLNLLYAQDMFSAFMWAMAKTLAKPMNGPVDIRPDGINDNNVWQFFTLRNERLSKMAQDIQSTGLGSLEDIYLSIIPPLSIERKLPQPDSMIELARQQAKKHEKLGQWGRAGDAYLWLFRMAKRFPEQSDITTKVTAISMEYLRHLVSVIEPKEAQQGDSDSRRLKEVKSSLEKELRFVGRATLSSFMGLYEELGHGWKCVPVLEARTGWVEDAGYTTSPEMFKLKSLHRLYRPGSRGTKDIIAEALQNGEDVNQKDVRDWTPLHYVATKGTADVANELLRRRADVNARDLLEWAPLHYACQRGDTSVVQSLIREAADVNAQGRDGVAPLHCAAMNGHGKVARLLIEAGAAIGVLDAFGNTPLFWSASKGHIDMVEYLWGDTDRRLRDNDGRTALHLAAAAGMREVAKWLVENGADQDAKDRAGKTPLLWATHKGHIGAVAYLWGVSNGSLRDSDGRSAMHLAATSGMKEVAMWLVENGADQEAKDRAGRTPLHWAAGHGQEVIVKLLLGSADKEAKDELGQTPLHVAALEGHEAIVRLLAEIANKEAKDDLGQTPLSLATRNGDKAIVRLLVEAGADMEARDRLGSAPLHLATRNEDKALVALLLDAGANVEAQDHSGSVPLHLAVRNGDKTIVELLIEGAANMEARDSGGQTPLHQAVQNGHEAMVMAGLLIRAGADVEAKDNKGRTPLHHAAAAGHRVLTRLLIRLEANMEARDDDDKTPLQLAAMNGHEDMRLLARPDW